MLSAARHIEPGRAGVLILRVWVEGSGDDQQLRIRMVGRPDLGRLAPGAAADLAWLGDDLCVRRTWVGGEQVYPR